MQRELTSAERLEVLTDGIADATASLDNAEFPQPAFALLRDHGLLARPPIEHQDIARLLAVLAAVGRGDLSTGRIFEGHVNACLLIASFGNAAQRAVSKGRLETGSILGVWNTDAPDDPLRLENDQLQGKKNFASGVDGLSHAIITITRDNGRQMLLVPLAGLSVDRTWWQPVGMKASGSHIVDFSTLTPQADWFLGGPDDYIGQPMFSAGAIRFLAVQVGGMHRIFDIARDHLVRTKRADNPYQAHRLARMGSYVECGYLWLRQAADRWKAATARNSAEDNASLIATVNGARLAVEAAAMSVLGEAEQAIGAAGMITPHPFERIMRDLRTYLRQPNPDGAATAFGAAIANGSWTPANMLGQDAQP